MFTVDYVSCGFVIYDVSCVEVYFFHIRFIEGFNYESESESCSVVSDSLWSHGYTVHGILQARILRYHICWFVYVKPFLYPMDKSHSLCIIFFIYCWIWFANFFFGLFACILFRGIGLEISCRVLIWLLFQGNASLMKLVYKCFLLFNFLSSWKMLVFTLILHSILSQIFVFSFQL